MTSKLKTLERHIGDTTGQSRYLDQMIASTLDCVAEMHPTEQYTASVDACVSLINRILPRWHWHVGHGPRGILPYAALRKSQATDSAEELRVEATAPTVPLALLHAAVGALIAEEKATTCPGVGRDICT
jgi:hypothetical protein